MPMNKICLSFAVNPTLLPPHILHGYQFQCKGMVVVFYLVYLTPYMVLEGKHERLDVRCTFIDASEVN
jgi:hypothetical protein